MSIVNETSLAGVLEIIPTRFFDNRGFFSETYSSQGLREHGVELDFIQDNHSHSHQAGVIRGLHFQREPFAQAKLIQVINGSIYDVAVDIRKGSPTYGKWVGIEITAEKGNQLFVPSGFAHGFVTLEPNTDILYKVTNYYCKEEERAIRYNDPSIGINWPTNFDELIVSDKDEEAPFLNQIDNNNIYEWSI
jgi:dTDP-4-dehydrorhamnose 3,5-epimerase